MHHTDVPKTTSNRFSQILIEPRSSTIDQRRQERILNILLVSLAVCAVLALAVSGYNYLFAPGTHSHNSLLYTALFCGIVTGLLVVSRRGHFKAASIGFLAVLSVATLQLTLQWSFELQQALLMYVLIIVIAGVTSRARFGLLFAATMSIVFLVISFFQAKGDLFADTSWKRNESSFSDAIGYAVTFLVIAVVAWLSNREIDRSLTRARNSERALAAERDSLEAKVAERTQEIEKQQLIRSMELRRFAEFGRLSANLLHEVANPLTAASINLELIESGEYSSQVVQARKNLQHLERYVEAARKQLKGEGEIARFAIRKEVRQVLRIIDPNASRNQIKIIPTIHGQPSLRGDSVKFSQIIANLLFNAIEAYDSVPTTHQKPKRILLSIEANTDYVRCSITDQGKGISQNDIANIFIRQNQAQHGAWALDFLW